MSPAHSSASIIDSSRNWSLFAGLYMFIWGTAVALLLSDMLALLADVIGLSTEYWMVVFASPAFAIGVVVWWTAIERRNSYTYLLGGTFGLITALLTGLLWTAQFVRFWGFEMAEIPIIGFLIAFVLGITTVAGVITAIPLMYVRRRLDSTLLGGTEDA